MLSFPHTSLSSSTGSVLKKANTCALTMPECTTGQHLSPYHARMLQANTFPFLCQNATGYNCHIISENIWAKTWEHQTQTQNLPAWEGLTECEVGECYLCTPAHLWETANTSSQFNCLENTVYHNQHFVFYCQPPGTNWWVPCDLNPSPGVFREDLDMWSELPCAEAPEELQRSSGADVHNLNRSAHATR